MIWPSWTLPSWWWWFVALVGSIGAAYEIHHQLTEEIEKVRTQKKPDLIIQFADGTRRKDIVRYKPRPKKMTKLPDSTLPPETRAALSKFYRQIEPTLRNLPKLASSSILSMPSGYEIQLKIVNQGNATATDIHVWMDAPGLNPQSERTLLTQWSATIEGERVRFPTISKLQDGFCKELPKIYVNPDKDGFYYIEWFAKAEGVPEPFEGKLIVKVSTEEVEESEDGPKDYTN